MPNSWLFAYGTLRPDGALYGLIKPGVEHVFEPVTANGRLYHIADSTADNPIYPVADFSEAGLVVGSLILVVPGADRLILSIELNAGYQEIHIPVDVPGWREPVAATTYHWPWRHGRGSTMASGDWKLLKFLGT